MNNIIGSGNKISFDLGLHPLLDSGYFKLSVTDNTYLKRKLLLETNREVFIKLLRDVLIQNIIKPIYMAGHEVHPSIYAAKVELDEKDEILTISFDLPDGMTPEMMNTILKEEFKDEPTKDTSRRILRLL